MCLLDAIIGWNIGQGFLIGFPGLVELDGQCEDITQALINANDHVSLRLLS
jgi:hypothetical protein